jgi:hypothetical protein
MAHCPICDSPGLEAVHAAARPVAGKLPIAFCYLDWNRIDPVSGAVARPRSHAPEKRRRA